MRWDVGEPATETLGRIELPALWILSKQGRLKRMDNSCFNSDVTVLNFLRMFLNSHSYYRLQTYASRDEKQISFKK